MDLSRVFRLSLLIFLAADFCDAAHPGVFFFERDQLFEQAVTRLHEPDAVLEPARDPRVAVVPPVTMDPAHAKSIAPMPPVKTRAVAAWQSGRRLVRPAAHAGQASADDAPHDA